MGVKVLILNCTLRKSPHVSTKDRLVLRVENLYRKLKIKTEILRPIDHFDNFENLLTKIKSCNILIIASPIYGEGQFFVAKMLFQKLKEFSKSGPTLKDQYPLYHKIGGAILTGNKEGFDEVAKDILFNLMKLGAIIPRYSDIYWVGENPAGVNYIEGGGDKNEYNEKRIKYLVQNTLYTAELLDEYPVSPGAISFNELPEQDFFPERR